MFRTIASIASALLALVAASQSDYYVNSGTGDDANDGLSDTTAWKTIQKSFDSATPGSTVWISGGPYEEHPVLHVSGLPGQPITFRSTGNSVTLEGDSSISNTMLTIEDQRHIVIRGFRLQNLTMPDAIGLMIRATPTGGSSDITIRRCTMRWIGWSTDVAAMPTDQDNAQPLIVRGEGLGAANAINGLVIDSTHVYENVTGYSEAISLDGNVENFLIRECDVHDNTNIGILMAGNYGVSATLGYDRARVGIVQDNRCWANVSPYATSAGIYVDGARDITIDRNFSWENGYGIEVGAEQDGSVQNVVVTNNLIHTNHDAGLAIGGYDTTTTGEVHDCIIRNNTFLSNDMDGNGSGEVYFTKAATLIIRNNLFVTSTQAILFSREEMPWQFGIQCNYNGWYTPAGDSASVEVNWGDSLITGFSDYQTSTGRDADGFFADPLAVNPSAIGPDMHLLPGSPCIDAGDPSTVITLLETALDGGQRIIGPRVDIGAYEFDPNAALHETEITDPLLFPNPCQDRLLIPSSLQELAIHDARGRLLLQRTSPEPVIDLRGLPAGLWMVHFEFTNSTRSAARVVHLVD